LSLRFSDLDRTLKSAHSFLGGAFPAQAANEVMVIHHENADGEPLRPSPVVCAERARALRESELEQAGLAKKRWADIKHIADYVKVSFSWGNLAVLADWVAVHDCMDRALPSIVGPEDRTACYAICAELMYGVIARNASLFVSPTMREVLRVARERFDGASKVRLILISTHDTTFATFIASLSSPRQISRARIPPYRSHLLMEVWHDSRGARHVRWVFNGEVLELVPFGGRVLVPYREFVTRAERDVAGPFVNSLFRGVGCCAIPSLDLRCLMTCARSTHRRRFALRANGDTARLDEPGPIAPL